MTLQRVDTDAMHHERDLQRLAPLDCDPDTTSRRSNQESDSDDDERQRRARNSRELRAHDRLVLMEEDEMDYLVTETRRKQEQQRRGSGIPIPDPLRLFARQNAHVSRSRSRPRSLGSEGSAVRSTESLELPASFKRGKRRARRREKKDRLLAEAQHGENKALMFEMEEGGMKDGSSTGESSERDDSGEIDRRGLLNLADAKNRRSRQRQRWVLKHTLLAAGFAILVLVGWKIAMAHRRVPWTASHASNGTDMFAPTTIIISLDGFRADFLQRGLTPRLNQLVREGVSPLYMLPSFPSVTFPNHYTLATGLFPESHGVVGNSFWDPAMQAEFFYTDPARSMEAKWWMGEPFWVTAERIGIKTAIHMWPGSEAHIMGTEPTYLDKYNSKEKLGNKVDRIMEFLDMPSADRPQIIAAYVPNVDADGHLYGPNSTEIQATIQSVDMMLDRILLELEGRNLTNIVNVVVVSDHGMATTDTARLIQLEDLVDLDKIDSTDGWPLVGLRPKKLDDLQDMYESIVEKASKNPHIGPNVEIYLRDVNMPERYHFSHNDRIAPLWIVPKTGYAMVKKKEMNVQEALKAGTVYHPMGLHGYDNEHPLMRAIFVARGPAFPHKPNSRLEVFRKLQSHSVTGLDTILKVIAPANMSQENIEVYNILCDSVGLVPKPNNGTLRLPLKPIGQHETPELELERPGDPVATTSFATTVSAASSASVSVESGLSRPTLLVNPIAMSDASLAAQVTPSPPLIVDLPGEQPSNEASSIEKLGYKLHDFWDWFKGKLDEWADKMKSSEKE